MGDICLRFFDIDGKEVNLPLNERVVSIPLDQLRLAKRVVGVAGGRRKTNAIRGALNGKHIDILITDHLTANALMD